MKRKKKEKCSKSWRKTGGKSLLFSPISSSSNTYQKQNLALFLFYEAETSTFRRIFIQKKPKSSLEVHAPLSHGKSLCLPWVGLNQTKAAPKIFLISIFLYLWPPSLLWPLPPHLVALQGWGHLRVPPLALENQTLLNLGCKIQMQPEQELAGLTVLLWEWGWSSELKSEPGSWV